jgi:hypothetical protein
VRVAEVAERVVSRRGVNRAVLARQLLLERGRGSIPATLERVGGLHAQYAPSMYVGLWSRVEGLERGDLTDAIERRAVVQAAGHADAGHHPPRGPGRLLAGREATREARRRLWLRGRPGAPREGRDGGGGGPPAPDARRRLHRAARGRGAARQGREAAVEHIVRRYLAAFEPAPRTDVADWTGLPASEVARALGRMRLRIARGEDGEELLDLPRAPLPDPETPAPPRFLPTWDAVLLVHARRAGVLPEEYRPRIFGTRMPASLPTFLLDGAVAGTWRHEDGRIALDPFRWLAAAERRALDAEAERLLAVHAPVSRASAPPRRRRGA